MHHAVRRTVALTAGLLAMSGGTLPAFAGSPGAPTSKPVQHHALGGYRPGPVRVAAHVPYGSGARTAAAVPASVDLRASAPAVGDQGQISDCVAWTIAHSVMGYYA